MLYCQSCGHALKENKDFGTDKLGAMIQDYCIWCYKDGAFTADVTMDEMILLCANYVKSNVRDRAIKEMKIYFPQLKRWAQREDTQKEYYRSINKVLDFINENLFENLELENLSRIAHISPFHFHRIFKATIGETLGEYIHRLRLEYAAEKLSENAMHVGELATRIGYGNVQAFSKAFRKRYGLPPGIFKKTFAKKNNPKDVYPRFIRMDETYILYTDQTNEPEDILWKKLYTYAVIKKIFDYSTESVGISFAGLSESFILEPNFHPGLKKKGEFPSSGLFSKVTIPSGLYAIFVHKGSYSSTGSTLRLIDSYFKTRSKHKVSDDFLLIKYLNSRNQVAEEDLLSEIYIPLQICKICTEL